MQISKKGAGKPHGNLCLTLDHSFLHYTEWFLMSSKVIPPNSLPPGITASRFLLIHGPEKFPLNFLGGIVRDEIF